MSIGIGDFVEVFTLPGDNFDPDPRRFQAGDRFVITEESGQFVTDGEKDPDLGRVWVLKSRVRKVPDDQPFSEWFRNTIITDITDAPLETTMRNVARNLQKFTEAGHGS